MHAQCSLAISMDDEKRSIRLAEDKYRSFLHDAQADTQWRNGAPPNFDQVNLLFEEGRTKVYIITSFLLGIMFSFLFFANLVFCILIYLTYFTYLVYYMILL